MIENENTVDLDSQGMFEVGGVFYTLKFNLQKIKMVEKALGGVSFVAELNRSGGVLSFTMLDALFAVGLHDVVADKPVRGKKALEIQEALLRDVGLTDLLEIVSAKLQEDLAFLFQEN